ACGDDCLECMSPAYRRPSHSAKCSGSVSPSTGVIPQRSKPSSCAFVIIHSLSATAYMNQFCRNLRFSESLLARHSGEPMAPVYDSEPIEILVAPLVAVTMLHNGRLAANSGAHPQGQSKRRR